MCKKLCLAVGAAIVGLMIVNFTGAGSLIQVKWNETRSWMERQVPPETQLKRLHVEIDKIDKDIKKNLSKLASQEVEFKVLESDLETMKEQQTKLREELAAMTKALEGKSDKIAYNGRSFRPSDLAVKLESAVNAFEIRKAEIKSKDELITSKRQALELSHQRIAEMRDQKEKLRVTAAKLETRIEVVKLKQVDCPISLDDSQVSKCNDLASKLDRQLAETEKKTELLTRYGYDNDKPSVVLEQKSKEDVLQAAKKALQDDDTAVAVEK